ncbi:MAG: lytic transglycosylase domain-containing protein [Pseudomonadota bacterium]
MYRFTASFYAPSTAPTQDRGPLRNSGSAMRLPWAALLFAITLAVVAVFPTGAKALAQPTATFDAALKALYSDKPQTVLKLRKRLRAGSIQRKTLDWAIALRGRGFSPQTLVEVSRGLNTWPGYMTRRRVFEKTLMNNVGNYSDADLRFAFSRTDPTTVPAQIALAKAELRAGNKKRARKLIASTFRNAKLTKAQEADITRNLNSVLTREDYVARIEFLLSRDRVTAATRLAPRAGRVRLVKARAAVLRKSGAAQALVMVPNNQRKTANYLYSKGKFQRRQGKLRTAARTLLSVPRGAVHPNFADKYANEMRILASDLIEKGDYQTAYLIFRRNVAGRNVRKIEMDFGAGWTALRKIGDAKTAARHFRDLLKRAKRDYHKARGYYWLARALEAQGEGSKAQANYRAAAQFDTTFYGQIATNKLGVKRISIKKPRPTAEDRAAYKRNELVQAIALIENAGYPNRAGIIYRFLGWRLKSAGQLAILAAQAERRGRHAWSLHIGRTAFSRGFEYETLAWPLGAIPRKTRMHGASLPVVYGVARQESAFKIDVISGVNAHGLLQLLPGTAKMVAGWVGLPYNKARLTQDPGYNAELGSAFLARNLKRFNGSLIMTLAAYNAGPKRPEEWVKRFGDPRGKSAEVALDFIEQIPFRETRNYVQKCLENYHIYRTRLTGAPLDAVGAVTAGRPG